MGLIKEKENSMTIYSISIILLKSSSAEIAYWTTSFAIF